VVAEETRACLSSLSVAWGLSRRLIWKGSVGQNSNRIAFYGRLKPTSHISIAGTECASSSWRCFFWALYNGDYLVVVPKFIFPHAETYCSLPTTMIIVYLRMSDTARSCTHYCSKAGGPTQGRNRTYWRLACPLRLAPHQKATGRRIAESRWCWITIAGS
jgi:hypothetical protein